MTCKIIVLVLSIVVIACSNNNDNAFAKEKVHIAISVAHSYKYDIENGIYTVYFMAKPPLQVKFHLPNDEKERIKRMLVTLELNREGELEHFKDGCTMFPKLIDTLHLTSSTVFKKISIDLNCNDYSSFKAKRIKEFMVYVLRMVNAMPEIRSAPETDIHYM